jgi:hypothetical protein
MPCRSARGIIESHGGTLTLEHPPEGGAAFAITLPVTTPTTATAAPAAAGEVMGLLMLGVDHEPDVADVLVDMLSIDGHRSEGAPNGWVALKRLQGGRERPGEVIQQIMGAADRDAQRV